MIDEEGNPRALLMAAGFFAAIFSLIAWDVIGDYSHGADWLHMGVELLVLCVAALGMGMLGHRYLSARRDISVLRSDLSAAQETVEQAQQWRQENLHLVHGLGRSIESQFQRWHLSQAEASVGLLLLKGFSHKEISHLRNTSERTVRDQARAIYRKGGLTGRSSLSAFFLEDLLLPQSGDA